MVGKVVVEIRRRSSTPILEMMKTPGFGLVLGVLAVIGIALISRRHKDNTH